MEYIASISYGKDSMAMLEVIHCNGLPLDRIAHVEIMAAPGLPADLPEVMDWKKKADDIILQRYGIQVEHITAEKTFEEMFYGIPARTEKNTAMQGTIRGFPSLRSQWCSKALKVEVMRRHFQGAVQYIGIAADEPERFGQLTDKVRSPLVEFGVTEPECLDICRGLDLVAPTYLQSKRSGCWFCPAQPIQQLRLLRQQHPELWYKLLEWDSASPVPFRHGGNSGTKTLRDFERRFRLEDKSIIHAGDFSFKWAKMEAYEKGQTLCIYPNLLEQKAIHHLNDVQMAQIIGITRIPYLQRIKNGRFTPEQCLAFCKYFGKSFEYLFAIDSDADEKIT